MTDETKDELKNIKKTMAIFGDAIINNKVEGGLINTWLISKIINYLLLSDKGFIVFLKVTIEEMETEMNAWAKQNKVGDVARQSLDKVIKETKTRVEEYMKFVEDKDKLVEKATQDAEDTIKKIEEERS